MSKKIIPLDELQNTNKKNKRYHQNLQVEIPKNHLCVVIIPYLLRKKQIDPNKSLLAQVQAKMDDYHFRTSLRKLGKLIDESKIEKGIIFAAYNYKEIADNKKYAQEILKKLDATTLKEKSINFLEYGFDEGFIYLKHENHEFINKCEKNKINFILMRKQDNDWLSAILSNYSKKMGYVLEHIPILFIKIK